MPTQLPRVPSLMPSSFATLAIGRDVSITIFTASSLKPGEKLFFSRGNYFTFPDIHPIGWAVRKPRGTPVRILGVSSTRVMNVSGSDCSSCGSSRRAPVQGIAVGTALAGGPPPRSPRALLTHQAPALGLGVEPLAWERMHHAGGW